MACTCPGTDNMLWCLGTAGQGPHEWSSRDSCAEGGLWLFGKPPYCVMDLLPKPCPPVPAARWRVTWHRCVCESK